MKITRLILSCIFLLMPKSSTAEWNPISLPNLFMEPCIDKPCGNRGTHVYSLQFPTAPLKWFPPEADCPKKDAMGKDIYRMTSTRWRSNYIEKVNGLSFKGLIYKGKESDTNKNEFAVFFHEEKCYNGGAEYGWVIYENNKQAYFYLCGDCNIKDKPPFWRPQQTWYTWPGDLDCIAGDCAGVLEKLKNPAVYRYSNIDILANGDFALSLINPVDWSKHECIIKKPGLFPNLRGKGGYITINAQKGAETTVRPAPFMHIDEVKVNQ